MRSNQLLISLACLILIGALLYFFPTVCKGQEISNKYDSLDSVQTNNYDTVTTYTFNRCDVDIFVCMNSQVVNKIFIPAYVVYANLDDPYNPYVAENGQLNAYQLMIKGKELSITVSAYDIDRGVLIPYYNILYYEILP